MIAKLLEENTGECFMTLDLQHFLSYDTKSTGNKSRIKLYQKVVNILCIKGHTQQSGKAAYKMEKIVAKLIRFVNNIHNILI